MFPRRRALKTLAACLRGEPPRDADWLTIVEAANQAMVTPALAVAMKDRPLPDDVFEFLTFIRARNAERNLRIRDQLAETSAALNAAGITPTVLKGGAWLLGAAEESVGDRMITDLDIMVPGDGASGAVEALAAIGYEIDSAPSDLSHHFQADLRRPKDVALVDLHRRPPGPAAFHDLAQLARHCRPVSCGDGQALVPSVTFQAMHLIAHDQFHDGDYWLGKIDLRHLVDLATMARTQEGIDFDLLARLMPGALARDGLQAQLRSLHELLGVPVPAAVLASRSAGLQHRRRLVQLDLPFLRVPFAAATILSQWRNYRELQRLNGTVRGAPREPAAAQEPAKGGRLERWTRLLTSDGTGKL
jgi:hypothetical protein